jgi:hypothetical protein
MACLRLSSHNLGVEIGRHHRVVYFARGCKRCAALDPPVDDETQLLMWLGESVDFYNCHLRRCRISCVVGMFMGWHYLCTSA